jgi:hypothetical protein
MVGHDLSASEKRQADRDGYVIRERVFDAGEVAAIIDECERLVARIVENREGRRYELGSYVFDPDELTGVTIKWEGHSDVVHGLEPFAHMWPALEHWALDPRFVDPMKHFCGDPAPVLFTEKLNLKRPHVGGVNPLHQDFPYWDGFADDPARTATAMLFLDDADLGNGTLQVLPGSHTSGRWQTRTDRDVFGNLEAEPGLEDGRDVVAVEVPAGSVVYFGSFLVHKSAPNTSGRERRSLLYSYAPAGNRHSRELSLLQREEARRRKAAAASG